MTFDQLITSYAIIGMAYTLALSIRKHKAIKKAVDETTSGILSTLSPTLQPLGAIVAALAITAIMAAVIAIWPVSAFCNIRHDIRQLKVNKQ